MIPAGFIARKLPLLIVTSACCIFSGATAQAQLAMRFQANIPAEAVSWQKAARQKLFSLMMGGAEPARCPLDVKVLRRVEVPQDPKPA